MSHASTLRFGKRYIGNKRTKVVHDLINEDKKPSGCQIDNILRSGHGVGFYPDTLIQAHLESYEKCSKCMKNSEN
jgi:hypothetical protein